MARDITRQHYIKIMLARGFDGPSEPFSTWRLPEPYTNHHVSDLNAGERRRAKLAYMLAQHEQVIIRETGEAMKTKRILRNKRPCAK